jgi:hypothetical protein
MKMPILILLCGFLLDKRMVGESVDIPLLLAGLGQHIKIRKT